MSAKEKRHAAKIYEVNNCLIDLGLKEITCYNEVYRPDDETLDTLVYLIENRDHAISIDELRRELWGDQDVSEFEIVRSIMQARRAINDQNDNSTIRYVENLPGYCFCGEVFEVEIGC